MIDPPIGWLGMGADRGSGIVATVLPHPALKQVPLPNRR